MNRNTLVKWIFRILFFAISAYHTVAYLEYGSVIESDVPIEYTYMNKKIHKGGRGEWYQMTVAYQAKKYDVVITSSIYEQIEENKLPSLYYSSKRDAVFSLWEKKRALRITLLFIAGCLLTFVPFNKFLKK